MPNIISDDIFYTRMLTSANGKSCSMRFYYYTDGEPINVTRITLNIHARLVTNKEMDSRPLLQVAGNMRQAWSKVVVRYQSTTPFQFAFNAHQMDTRSRLAVDDISFDPNTCAPSTATRQKFSTTTTPPSKQPTSNSGHRTSTSTPPSISKPNKHHGPGGAIAAGILVPLLLVLGAIGGYYGYRRYRRLNSHGENMALSFSGLKSKAND